MLDVPVLSDSPVSFELEVDKIIELDENDNVVLLCKVKNVLMDELLAGDDMTVDEKLRAIAPVSTTCMTYFGWDGKKLGAWHELAGRVNG